MSAKRKLVDDPLTEECSLGAKQLSRGGSPHDWVQVVACRGTIEQKLRAHCMARSQFTAVSVNTAWISGAGVGVIIPAGQRFSIDSAEEAIVLTMEAQWLELALAGISTYAPTEGQRWLGADRSRNGDTWSWCANECCSSTVKLIDCFVVLVV